MIAVFMGPMGSGKTTVGRLFAQRFGWDFADGDDFHPPANVEKMRRGVPLEDADRRPWLAALRAAMEEWSVRKRNVVLACSALKQIYREQLFAGPDVRYVYLEGSPALIGERLRHRAGHFASADLLASQFAILEVPANAITVGIDQPPAGIVEEIARKLGIED